MRQLKVRIAGWGGGQPRLCCNVFGVLGSRRGDYANRSILQPCFYGLAHADTECIIHACQACPDFVVVAHPQLEVSGDEGREGGDILALSWQCTSLSWLVAGHTRVERQPRYALGSLFLKFHRLCRRICPLPLRRRVPYREVEHGQDRAGDYHQQRSENYHGGHHLCTNHHTIRTITIRIAISSM